MNRAERRRIGRENSDPIISIKQSEINKIKSDAVNEAVDTAFMLMLSIPVMVLHDKYPQLTRKEVDGKSRAERFSEMCLDLYDSYNRGYISFEELEQCLYEEAGVKPMFNRKEA
jgi:hypothetical protein